MHRAATVKHTIAHLNEYWFTLPIITEEFVTIGNGMQPSRKMLTYLRRYAANNWQISTSCLYIVE